MRPPKARHCCAERGFNPRICKRCDGVAPLVGLTTYVSIHASVKDATQCSCCPCDHGDCFNPRICKRCDCCLCENARGNKVSIHASVKDATWCIPGGHVDPGVSIHASVKDATSVTNQPPKHLKVSIHASVKDATLKACPNLWT